jgi:hypothetical protein
MLNCISYKIANSVTDDDLIFIKDYPNTVVSNNGLVFTNIESGQTEFEEFDENHTYSNKIPFIYAPDLYGKNKVAFKY